MAVEKSVGVHEAKTQFSRLLREVAEGHEVTVTHGGTPVARIVPVEARSRVAQSRGMFPGRFPLTDEFDRDEDELGDLFGVPR